MTPHELGESASLDTLPYLAIYLKNGTDDDKRLAASAVQKLSKIYYREFHKLIPFLVQNLNNPKAQTRLYSLKALRDLEIHEKHYKIIKQVGLFDEKNYNRNLANEIIWIMEESKPDGHYDTALQELEDTAEAAPSEFATDEGFVYFIQEDFSYKVKIGKTKNLDQRLSTFDVKLPFNILLIHSINTKNMSYTEKLFHLHFDSKRVRGEWFDLNEEDISWIKQNAYTRKIDSSIHNEHFSKAQNKKPLYITDKQLDFLHTLIKGEGAMLTKPIRRLTKKEAQYLINHMNNGDILPEGMTNLIYRNLDAVQQG